MTQITKIVLTGGPCAGKTSALEYLSAKLGEYGVEVFEVQEQATALKNSGKTPENMGSFAFHRLLFGNQLIHENEALKKAEKSEKGRALIICDRGLLDSRAYVTAEEFSRYSGEYGFNEDKLRSRYDAVFHLVTAADGAEEHYTLANNGARDEDLELARERDSAVLSLWVGAAHLRVIDNSTDFDGKLERLLSEVLAALGIPEPLEIERKFLMEYPDLDSLSKITACRRIPITQAYLNTPEEGRFRVRKRGEGEGAVFIKTVKHKINDMKRIEIEDYISEEEYYDHLSRKEYVEGVISKDRWCFVWKSQYFELDVYPFWADRVTLEIELLGEDSEYKLPDFLTLIREVTTEKKYRNKWLASVYGRLFS